MSPENTEQSNSEPMGIEAMSQVLSGNTENPNQCAHAPVDTIHGLLEAFCYSKRDVPGFVGVTVRLDEWRATIPLSEFYGLLTRLARS